MFVMMNFQTFSANFNGSLATYLNLLAQFQLLTFETFIQRIFNFSPPIIDHWNQFHEERGVLKAELRAPTFLQDRGRGRGMGVGLNRVQCCGNSTCNRKLWFPENEVLTFHNININTSIIYILLEDLIYCCLVFGLCFKHLHFPSLDMNWNLYLILT